MAGPAWFAAAGLHPKAKVRDGPARGEAVVLRLVSSVGEEVVGGGGAAGEGQHVDPVVVGAAEEEPGLVAGGHHRPAGEGHGGGKLDLQDGDRGSRRQDAVGGRRGDALADGATTIASRCAAPAPMVIGPTDTGTRPAEPISSV